MSDRLALLGPILRTSLSHFVQRCFLELEPGRAFRPNWHIDAITHCLSRVRAGEVTRQIINIPPRHLKTLCVSIAYTAWVLGNDPTRRVLVVAYSDELARITARQFRQVVESPWYRQTFPRFAIKTNRSDEVVTTLNGFFRTRSINGSVLGTGADLIVIDDPIKTKDVSSRVQRQKVNDLFDNSLYTRLDDKSRGAIVIVMQRLHAEDLVGHVLEQGQDWQVLAIPAIEAEDRDYRTGPRERDVHHRRAGEPIQATRESLEALEDLRTVLGSFNFSAQYQQQPVPPGGQAFKREWLRYYDELPEGFDFRLASWDTASTLGEASDYSVGTYWGLKGHDIYLIDVVRGKFEVPDLRRHIEALTLDNDINATVIEKTDIGHAILQEMRRSSRVLPILSTPQYDKEARFLAQTPKFEAGQVLFPREAPWLAELVRELVEFPNGAHDDQVDSISQALKYLSRKIPTPREVDRQAARAARRRPLWNGGG